MQKKSKDASKNYSLSYPKIVALGFLSIILIGTALLMLPAASKNGNKAFIDALFTATSATCITGLVPFDTYTSWSTFGQIVILALIQIGGLGFITVLTLVSGRLGKRKMGLKQKMLLKESVGSLNLGDVKDLTKSVLLFTFICELTGAVILSTRLVPLANSWSKGIYMAVFTSISAYCNAGFDLMGLISPSSSLTTVNSDPVIILTVSLLVIFGGLGFIVWQDIRKNKFNVKALSVHTKLVLVTTAALLAIGTTLFFVFEYKNSFAQMNVFEKILNAFFCSVTPRTAGFNSVDIADMSQQSNMLTIILMFIGGSSGSTAGGVKTTTIAVLVLCAVSNMRNREEIDIFGKRIGFSTVKNAISTILINFANILFAVVVITLSQPNFKLIEVIYECVSAMGTVGITMGITPQLNTVSALAIILLMYIGRLTSLIFALSFVGSKPATTTQKPKGTVLIG
ncbi:MAG: TrkH family potassium uptake protein [Eubacterium sp.]